MSIKSCRTCNWHWPDKEPQACCHGHGDFWPCDERGWCEDWELDVRRAPDQKTVNRHGHEIRPYYSTGIELPLLIGVVDENGTEHAYIRKQEWIDERNARIAEVAALKARIDELKTRIDEFEHVAYLCDMCANDCDERRAIHVGQGAYTVCERWKEIEE